MSDDALLTSLLNAVAAAPDDVPLRLHVAELLAAAQRVPEALQHVTHALTVQPGDAAAIALLQRLGAALARRRRPPLRSGRPGSTGGRPRTRCATSGSRPSRRTSPSAVTEDVDLAERPALRLADVGGMEHVKQRLELSFLGPIRNPQLASAFGATAGGGLLLYGPPGCGKTFIARAVAGEIGAAVLRVRRGRRAGHVDRQQRAQPGRDLRRGPAQRPLRAVLRRGRRARPQALAPDHVQQHAQHGQPAAGRDGLAVAAATTACSCSARPTTRGTWTARCAAPAGSTGCCWCCRRTRRPGRRSCATTCATGRSADVDLEQDRQGHRALLRGRPRAPVRHRRRAGAGRVDALRPAGPADHPRTC